MKPVTAKADRCVAQTGKSSNGASSRQRVPEMVDACLLQAGRTCRVGRACAQYASLLCVKTFLPKTHSCILQYVATDSSGHLEWSLGVGVIGYGAEVPGALAARAVSEQPSARAPQGSLPVLRLAHCVALGVCMRRRACPWVCPEGWRPSLPPALMPACAACV